MVLQNLSRLILRISGIRISEKIMVFFNCTKQLDFKDHNTVGITDFISYRVCLPSTAHKNIGNRSSL